MNLLELRKEIVFLPLFLLVLAFCFSFGKTISASDLSSFQDLPEPDWVKVKDLKVGDLLRTKEGWVEIESIEYIQEPITVYNLTVDYPNTFWANGILAHNKGEIVRPFCRDTFEVFPDPPWPGDYGCEFGQNRYLFITWGRARGQDESDSIGDLRQLLTLQDPCWMLKPITEATITEYDVYGVEVAHSQVAVDPACGEIGNPSPGFNCQHYTNGVVLPNDPLNCKPGVTPCQSYGRIEYGGGNCQINILDPQQVRCNGCPGGWWSKHPDTVKIVANIWYGRAMSSEHDCQCEIPKDSDCGDTFVTNNSDFDCACSQLNPDIWQGSFHNVSFVDEFTCKVNDDEDDGLLHNDQDLEGQIFERGQTYTWQTYCVKGSLNHRANVKIWADWDGNGGNLPEVIKTYNSIKTFCYSTDWSVTIPAWATDDAYIRARAQDDVSGQFGDNDYNASDDHHGEIEDYHINIIGTALSCDSVEFNYSPGPPPDPIELEVGELTTVEVVSADVVGGSWASDGDYIQGSNQIPAGHLTVGPPGLTVNVTGAVAGSGNIDFTAVLTNGEICPTVTIPFTVTEPAAFAWLQTEGGDVHAGGGINNYIPDGSYCSLKGDGGYAGVVSFVDDYDFEEGLGQGRDKVSEDDWLVDLETTFPKPDFGYFYQTLGSPSVNFNNGDPLPGTTGVYYSDGNVVIDGGNVSGNNKVVLLVRGNLGISNKITVEMVEMVEMGSFLAIIVSGDIYIKGTLGSLDETDPILEGFYLADGQIRTNCGSVINCPNPVAGAGRLVGKGMFIAGSYDFGRDLEVDNDDYPAELFIYRPDLWVNSHESLWPSSFSWQELAPGEIPD